MPIFTLALLFISSKNQLSPIKIGITQIKGVVPMQIRHAIKFHALNFLFIILHVVIVTLRAKAYDVKILNDVITSRHYVAIVCECSLRQQ